jgi:hypothetical protein
MATVSDGKDTCAICGSTITPAMPGIVLHSSLDQKSPAIRVCGDECARKAEGLGDFYLDKTFDNSIGGEKR